MVEIIKRLICHGEATPRLFKGIKNYFNYAEWAILIWGLAFVFSMQICIFWGCIKTPYFKSDMQKEQGRILPNDYTRIAKGAIK
jgi:hypothetical protein